MTSRFAESFLCFNGPKQGEYVDSQPGAAVGSACAVPWFDAKGVLRYCVYVLTEHQGTTGLMFIKTHDTTLSAQEQVHRITAVVNMAKEAAATN